MALVFNIPPAGGATTGVLAARIDRAVHGMTLKQITVTMSAGSATDYAAGGITITPASAGLRQIISLLGVSCQLGNGTAILIDPAWDHVNSKLALYVSATPHNEITNNLTAGSVVRVTFLGV